jgi:hypothetical protein
MMSLKNAVYLKENAVYPKGNVLTLRYAAAALAFASELIHLWVLPGQLVAAMLPGVFFLLVAIGQGLLGASLLFGPGRWALRFGILLNVFVILVWLFTRVVSTPELFQPLRLPVEGLGALATAIEVALVILLVGLRRSVPPKKRKKRRVRWVTRKETTGRQEVPEWQHS